LFNSFDHTDPLLWLKESAHSRLARFKNLRLDTGQFLQDAFSSQAKREMNVLLLTEANSECALFEEAIAKLPSNHSFTACESLGDLWAKATSRQIPLPNLIFLDFELSRSYDHELVQVLKSNIDFKAVPVVVYSDSADLEDILNTYGLQIACFIVLPKEPQKRRDKIQACLEFWDTYAELPELRRWWPDGISG
jgi:CheY-like chemotaxis protein